MTATNDTTDEISFGEDSKPEQEEKSLPPLAQNDEKGIKLWLDQDKNGDQYLRIDAPFLKTEVVFFDEEAKPTLNKFVEKWKEKRNGGD